MNRQEAIELATGALEHLEELCSLGGHGGRSLVCPDCDESTLVREILRSPDPAMKIWAWRTEMNDVYVGREEPDAAVYFGLQPFERDECWWWENYTDWLAAGLPELDVLLLTPLEMQIGVPTP